MPHSARPYNGFQHFNVNCQCLYKISTCLRVRVASSFYHFLPSPPSTASSPLLLLPLSPLSSFCHFLPSPLSTTYPLLLLSFLVATLSISPSPAASLQQSSSSLCSSPFVLFFLLVVVTSSSVSFLPSSILSSASFFPSSILSIHPSLLPLGCLSLSIALTLLIRRCLSATSRCGIVAAAASEAEAHSCIASMLRINIISPQFRPMQLLP